jgi:predicted permease
MFWRRRKNEDFSEEIQAHIALEAERLRAEGLSAREADAAARKRFGNVLSAEEQFYETNRWLWLEHLRRDMGYGLRVLLRNPGFTFVAMLSLALGIGVNALMFSVVNALVLRPLPVEKPGELVFLENNHFGIGQSFPNYRDFRDQNQVFSGLMAYRVVQIELDSRVGTARTWGYLATGNYFDVLGIQPALGRFFHKEDERGEGGSPYAVLSYGSWQARYGGDRDIVGKTIRINRHPYTVLGVAPRNFHGTEVFYWPEVWAPMMMEAQIEPGNPWLENRGTFNAWVIGRLKPGVSPSAATANLNTIAAELSRRYPDFDEGLQMHLTRPGLMGEVIGGPMRTVSFALMLMAGLVLLTACANLASMVTARGADREREIAIRLSIGATRWRVMRQILTETVVLAGLGGATGYGLAQVLSKLLSAWHAPMDFPIQFDVTPDWRVFLFAFAVSLVAGIVFGLAPARHAAKTDMNAVIKGEQLGWRGRRIALRDVLVVLQVAVCFTLVAASQLALRGLQRSTDIHLGFQPQGVSVVQFDLGLAGYTEERGRSFQKQALEAVQHMPGVTSTAYSNSVPLSIDENQNSVYPEDQPNLKASEVIAAATYEVSPNFFTTLGTRMLVGRDFSWHDDRKSPDVAVVNVAFAKQILHTDNPLGKRFHRGPGGPLMEVVGVVEDGKYETPIEAPRPAEFVAMEQHYNTTNTLLVRSSLPQNEVVANMRVAMAKLDPDLPLFGVGGLDQVLGLAFMPGRAAAIALSTFGILAILLAVTGIHGLVSYAVARRIREIGIRVAVGATPAQVLRVVLGRTAWLMTVGCAAGLVLTLALGRILSTLVYGASPRDPLALLGVLTVIILLGLFSSWAPARRAIRVDPVMALRHE